MRDKVVTVRKRAADNLELRVSHLLANTRAFLQKRNLDAALLKEKAVQQYPSAQVLLTSSPVQGLATPTSDIDLVAVTSDALSKNRMATQIYVGEHHCEVSAVSHDELAASLNALRTLAGSDPLDVMRTIQKWDKSHPIPRKYLERIVNGVSPEGEAPHAELIPDLATVWALQAYQRFVENAAALCLSVAAGEDRSPAVYAAGAVTDVMDALLCEAGFVYSNKKWILTRWTKDAGHALRDAPDTLSATNISALLRDIRSGLGGELPGGAAARVLELGAALAGRLFGDDVERHSRFAFAQAADARMLPFGKGAQVALFNGRAAVLRGDLPVDLSETIPFEGRDSVPADKARSFLTAIRTGLAKVELAA
ncbi:MAG: DUF6001 family protein [Rhizobiaceae bacterium]|nr:DUF6001 family protein [Rhizobiaceae bacterium]